MAVDYTKVFTVIGSYGDKINDYRAYIATYTSGQTAIETVLAAQTLVRLEDGLTDLFDDFKQDIADGSNDLVDRITTVLTDEALIGANFSFGTSPTLQLVFPALIHDMAGNDKNVAANTPTVGSKTYDTSNTTVGVLETGTMLDGITPPLNGAPAILDYAGLTTQLTPTSETLTFTCVSDSEHGSVRGSELFQITGVGPSGDGFDISGESSGQLGNITVCDNFQSIGSNFGFDTWVADSPSSWEVVSGVAGVDFEEGLETSINSGSSILSIDTDVEITLSQVIPATAFERNKTYFLAVWVARSTDIADPPGISITLSDGGDLSETFNVTATSTAWSHHVQQFICPPELADDVTIQLIIENDTANDPIYVDGIAIIPCEYHEGVAFAIFGGPEKFLNGDTISVPLSNNDAGKFQTLFRKAYKIQLPTDATPTISDSLYA